MKKIKYFILMGCLLAVFTQVSAQYKHKCDFDCPSHTFAVKFYATPMFTKLGSDLFADEETMKFGGRYGSDIMWYFYTKNKLRLSLNTGLAYTSYIGNRKLDYLENYEDMDVDNHHVVIDNKGMNFSENQHYNVLDIPVNLGAEYWFSKRFAAYGALGASYGFKLGSWFENSTDLTRTGYYEIYNVLIYDTDIDKSPYYFPLNKPVYNAGDYSGLNNISLEGALGIKYRIRPTITAFAGVKGLYGLTGIKENPTDVHHLLNSDFSLNTLMNRNDMIKTMALGAEVGVTFDIGECKRQPTDVEVSCKAVDAVTGQPIVALLTLLENGIETLRQVADKNGDIILDLAPGKKYDVKVTAPNYFEQNTSLDLQNVKAGEKQEISLRPMNRIVKGYVFHSNTINFETASDIIDKSSYPELEKIAKQMVDKPSLQLEVGGHTDDVGDEEYNRDLSERRARSVADFFKQRGVKPELISFKGYGETKPIADNTSDAGKSQNRRVEFTVIDFIREADLEPGQINRKNSPDGYPKFLSAEDWQDDLLTFAQRKRKNCFLGVRLVMEPQLGVIIQNGKNKIQPNTMDDLSKIGVEVAYCTGWVAAQVALIYPTTLDYKPSSEIVRNNWLKDAGHEVGIKFGATYGLTFIDGMFSVGYGTLYFRDKYFVDEYTGDKKNGFVYLNLQPVTIARNIVQGVRRQIEAKRQEVK